MKRFSINQLFQNKRFAVILALLGAVVGWILVATLGGTLTTDTIRNVPVDLSVQSGTISKLKLNVIEGGSQYVDVLVRGERATLGSLRPEDILTTASLSGVTEPGSYDLTLQPINPTERRDFEVIRYVPDTIKVRFDRLETRTFKVEHIVNGISVPPGYIWDQEQTVTPDEVDITGPLVELNKIAKCVVVADLEEPLEKNYAVDLPIQVLDTNDEPIDLEEKHLTMNHSESQLVIQVYKFTELPLEVEFLNDPPNFPLDDLRERMQLEADSIELAGPVNLINSYKEIRLGYIDLKYLDRSRSVYHFDVEMPSTQFVNMDNISSVAVTFDLEGFEEKYFHVSNIKILNAPANYDIKMLSSAIYNVKMIGEKDVMSGMTAKDIVAEIDFSQISVKPGQNKVPVLISAPSKGLVWALENHSVVVQVSER